MFIAIFGGAGAFGSRLAWLLRRDGHQVLVIGRSLAPLAALSDELGATAMQLDRTGDLSALWARKPEVVVDAAGPFHAYGDNPYRLAKAAIAQGVHYLDLADDAAFCAGIAELDEAARKAGVFALSGVSSVPALSSVVVAGLSKDASEIDSISSAILPGNRAPRGRSVVESILHQAGRPITQTIAGTQTKVQSWTDRRIFALAPGLRRAGYVIAVPDQTLFPAFFKARSVTFHAGLELEVMNRALAMLARLRGWTGLRLPDALILWGARRMSRFGSETGGMAVDVVWRSDTGWQRSAWRMIVRNGEGPYIPGVAARAILRVAQTIRAGARPALAEVSVDQIIAAMSDLAVETTTRQDAITPVFAQVLGDDFAKLPEAVRTSHDVPAPRRLHGRASVSRGPSLWARLIGTLFRFPPATADIPVTVTKIPAQGEERWTRVFGKTVFHSTLRSTPQGMTETFWPFTFDLDLHVAADALHFPVRQGRCLGMPLPRWMLPRSVAQETEVNGEFRFDVALYAPITGQLIVHYRGTLHDT